jgi:hypothetical protein
MVNVRDRSHTPISARCAKRSDGAALFVHDPDGLRVELLAKDKRVTAGKPQDYAH